MSRLRRPFLSDRYIFVTVNLLKVRGPLGEGDFERLAVAVRRMRSKQHFLLTAWVFLPDHWHAIFYPPSPLTVSQIFKAVKVSSMISLNHGRRESGDLWQGRFPSLDSGQAFDHALRTVKDYLATLDYIHSNPVWRGLVKRMEEVAQTCFLSLRLLVERARIRGDEPGGAGAAMRSGD